MAVRFAIITEEEIRQMNEEATPANIKSPCLVNTNIWFGLYPPPPVWIALFAHSSWLIRDGRS